MRYALLATLLALVSGCAGPNVDVTKTNKGFYPATDPNEVDILFTRPDRPFVELGSVLSTGWPPSDMAKMHNALRAKSAPLGANAVLVTSVNLIPIGYGMFVMSSNGVAIRYK